MINNKGLTDEQIQGLIDWKIQQDEFDKMMWKIHAEEIMRKIYRDSLK
jgi:hypothetical protein